MDQVDVLHRLLCVGLCATSAPLFVETMRGDQWGSHVKTADLHGESIMEQAEADKEHGCNEVNLPRFAGSTIYARLLKSHRTKSSFTSVPESGKVEKPGHRQGS